MTLLDLKFTIQRRHGNYKNFAEKVGKTEGYVTKIVTQRRNLSEKEKARWAAILNVKKRILFPDDGRKADRI